MKIQFDRDRLQLVGIDQLKPNKRNRNFHPKEQIDRLAKLIEYQGFRQPIIVSNQTGHIVVGHGRLLAAQQLGMTHVPVIYQDFESEEQEYAFSISDNSISLWSELDLAGINADLPGMGPFDIELLGIENFSVTPEEKFETEDELRDDMNKKFVIEVTFPNDMEMQDIHDDLVSRGYIVKIK